MYKYGFEMILFWFCLADVRFMIACIVLFKKKFCNICCKANLSVRIDFLFLFVKK